MGDRGQHLMTYSESLIRELHESGWEDMTMQEAGVLIWLTDLTASNPQLNLCLTKWEQPTVLLDTV